MEKNIWYYKLVVSDRKNEKTILSGDELKTLFDQLQKSKYAKYNKEKDIYSIKIPRHKNVKNDDAIDRKSAILDIYVNNDDYLFGTISNEKDPNTAQKRNNSNLETSDILLEDEKSLAHFEIFSYFMIHYKTSIISFVKSGGGPGVTKFCDLVNILEKYTIAVPAVIRSDTVDMIYASDYINQLTFSTVTPSMSALGALGLSDNQLSELSDSDIGDITITITANKLRTFTGSPIIGGLVGLYREKKLKKAKFSCKSNESQRYHSHNLFSDKFCASVEFLIDHTSNTENVRNEIENTLIDVYNDMEDTLLKSIKKS